MTVRVALRRMLRVPHPRARRRHWLVLGVAAALVAVVWVVSGASEVAYAGIGIGFAAVFVGLGRMLGWLALAIGLGVGLGFLPLFGVLGLELSLVTALFASIAGADVGSALARELARMPPTGVERAAYPGRTLARGALVAAGVAVAIALVPGVIAAVRGIWVQTCDSRFGILSYVAMPLASAALAGAIGHAMGVLVGPRRVFGAVVAQLPALLVAVAAVWRFHAAPPVYTYNAVLGYFPGNMYDEHVQLTAPLAWSRLEQLLWVIAVCSLVAWRFDVATYRVRRAPRPHSRRIDKLGLGLLAASGAVALRLYGGELGFAVDAGELEDALGGRIETAHFIIYYQRTPEIDNDLALIAEDHEFRYAQVVAQLGVEPEGKIESFYFADREQKARLHGSRDVEMAKPWRREIYLDHRTFPHSSLRHEIAHVIAAEFGDWLWGVSTQTVLGLPVLVNPGLVEGLATAVDWPSGYDRPTPHESVRILQKLDKQPSLDALLGLSFFSVSSAQGYTTAGSFLRFLLDRYGAPALRELYRSGGNFDAAYGKPRARLEAEWRDMIALIDVSEAVTKSSEERFRGGSVFAKPCVHAIAKRRERADDAYATGDRDGAIDLMRSVCSEAPGEPQYRLKLGDFLYGGEGVDRTEAFLIWQQVAVDDRMVTVTLRAQAIDRLVKAYVRAGDLARARALITYGQTLPLALDDRRQIDAMAYSLAHTGPAADALRAYFAGTTSPLGEAERAVLAEPELGFAHYLLAIQRWLKRDNAGAVQEFEQALARELPGPAFVKNAARLLANAAYRTHDTGGLAIATAILGGSTMATGDRLLAKDWQDRVQFDARR